MTRGKPDRTSSRRAGQRTRSPEETEELGKRLARTLTPPEVVLLRGDLGAGKTTFARGIAVGLGLSDSTLVNSPSFTLVNVYQGHCPIYHVDLYRLEGGRDLYSTGLEEFLGKDGVTIIEWSERLLFPFKEAVVVEFEDAGDEERVIRIHRPARRGAAEQRRTSQRAE